MIVLAALALQSMQTLAPPIEQARPATAWRCSFTDGAGNDFWLKGNFPEAPAGWDPNKGITTAIEGQAPDHLLGTVSVKVFDQTEETRDYFFAKIGADGSRYNFTLLLRDGRTGMATATHYQPDPTTGRGVLSAFAVGRCKAQFAPPEEAL